MKPLKDIIHRIFSPDVLVWLYPALLIIPNIILDITEFSSPLVKAANILLPLGVYLLLMGLWKNVGRTALFLFPVLFYAAFQIVLLYLYGESIIAVDMILNVFTTNVSEATELLGNLAIAIITVLILYIPPLIISIALVSGKKYAKADTMRKARKTSGWLLAVGGVCLLACFIFVPRFNILRDIFPVNVMHNTVTALKRTAATEDYYRTSANFSYKATSSRPVEDKEIYVLVIGETSRADNWQLFGYDRPTNPKLSRRDGLLKYPKTLSESNTTHKSVPLMMSWVTAKNFGDSIYTAKSVISAFNESGYRTAFFSNQGRNHSFIDFFAREAQSTVFLHDDSQTHYDAELVPMLIRFINESPSNKLFIVLHTYGSHFNYNERYPADRSVFTPDGNTEADRANRDELINAYDNTIVYTDALLDGIISALEAQNCRSALMYLSDHGEDIFDDRRGRFLHASPVPTYWQLHVPLLIWMSPQLRESQPELYAAGAKHQNLNVASSRVVFDTMLSLAGIETPYADRAKALTDSTYHQGKRLYLNDYNEGVVLDAAGLRSYDRDMLDSKGIAEK